MNDSAQRQQLNKAIAELANAVVEILTTSVQQRFAAIEQESGRLKAEPRAAMAREQMMTKKDVADYLKVSRRTVDNLMAKGYLPYIRLGSRAVRFNLATVEEALKRRSEFREWRR
jgi:excisionase family DNA binding protein